MNDTCKRLFLVDLETLKCLSIFLKREENDILDKDTLKICMQKRMKIVNLEPE